MTDYRTGPWYRSVVVQSLWRARYVILSAMLIAGVYGYGVSTLQAPTYSATSQLVLSADSNFSPTGNSTISDPNRFVSNQVSIMTSDPVLTAAAKALDDGTSAADLASTTKVSASSTNDVISVTSAAGTAAKAAARADAIANAYTTYNAAEVKAAAAAATASTTDTAVINSIKVQAATYGDGVAVVQPAVAPTAPSSPQPERNAALLFVATGLVASLLALMFRGRRGPGAALTEAAGGQLLGTVPVGPAPRAGRVEAPDPADHALALVALDYMVDDCPGVVLVTGASRASGTPSAVLGLATAAAPGRRVVVLEADVEGGDILTRCGAPLPARPLSAFAPAVEGATAAGSPRPAGAAKPAPRPLRDIVVSAPGVEGSAQRPSFDVALLATGADATAVLDGAGFDALRAAYDLILINAGPVTTDPLAFALLREVNAAVVVIGTTEDPALLDDVRTQLDLAHRPLTGVIAAAVVRGRRRRAWGQSRAVAPAPAVRPAMTERASASA